MRKVSRRKVIVGLAGLSTLLTAGVSRVFAQSGKLPLDATTDTRSVARTKTPGNWREFARSWWSDRKRARKRADRRSESGRRRGTSSSDEIPAARPVLNCESVQFRNLTSVERPDRIAIHLTYGHLIAEISNYGNAASWVCSVEFYHGPIEVLTGDVPFSDLERIAGDTIVVQPGEVKVVSVEAQLVREDLPQPIDPPTVSIPEFPVAFPDAGDESAADTLALIAVCHDPVLDPRGSTFSNDRRNMSSISINRRVTLR